MSLRGPQCCVNYEGSRNTPAEAWGRAMAEAYSKSQDTQCRTNICVKTIPQHALLQAVGRLYGPAARWCRYRRTNVVQRFHEHSRFMFFGDVALPYDTHYYPHLKTSAINRYSRTKPRGKLPQDGNRRCFRTIFRRGVLEIDAPLGACTSSPSSIMSGKNFDRTRGSCTRRPVIFI